MTYRNPLNHRTPENPYDREDRRCEVCGEWEYECECEDGGDE